MAKVTMGFGVLLALLGVWGWVVTGSEHPTALIPTYAGIVFIIFGVVANTDDTKRRALWMHIAVTVALLLGLGTVPSMVDAVRMHRGTPMAHPYAVGEKALMSVFCLVFVALCVRSFIAARRLRKSTTLPQ